MQVKGFYSTAIEINFLWYSGFCEESTPYKTNSVISNVQLISFSLDFNSDREALNAIWASGSPTQAKETWGWNGKSLSEA